MSPGKRRKTKYSPITDDVAEHLKSELKALMADAKEKNIFSPVINDQIKNPDGFKEIVDRKLQDAVDDLEKLVNERKTRNMQGVEAIRHRAKRQIRELTNYNFESGGKAEIYLRTAMYIAMRSEQVRWPDMMNEVVVAMRERGNDDHL